MKKNAPHLPNRPNQPHFVIGCVLVTVLCLLPGLAWGFASVASLSGTELADGVVVEIEDTYSRSEKSSGYFYRPIVEYVVAEKRYRCKTTVWSGSKFWAVGEPMQVRFKPDDPGAATIDSFFELWLGPLLFVLFGAFFLFLLYVGSFPSGAESKDPRIWWWRFAAGQLFCCAFLVPGLALGIVAYREGDGTEETTGTVVAVREVDHGTNYYRPIVEYEVQGKQYRCDDLEWCTGLPPRVGSKMTVRYRADNPHGVVSESSLRWLAPILLLGAGTVPEIAVIVHLIRRLKNRT